MSPILQTHHLTKQFGRIRAVNDVSLTVRSGDIYGFLGPNGAGKTVTIAMMLGLICPTQGEVRLLGERVTARNNQALRSVGALVGATPAFFPHLSARKNVELVASLYPDVPAGRIDEVLEIVDLKDAARRRPAKFSTGMKQRLAVAMAIVRNPKLLVLDEPTNGMDPGGMVAMRSLVQELGRQGTTIFISSHLLFEVEQVCNRIGILKQGQLVAEGTPEELRGSDRRVRVRVAREGDRDRVIALLDRLPETTDVVAGAEGIDVAGADGEAIVRCLTANDIFPSEVFYLGSDLENLFVELTEDAT